MEIRNIDNEIVKKANDNPISDNPLAPRHPFRMLVIGPSGCGKSNVVMNLVIDHLEFDKVYVYARDLTEDKYELLMDFYAAVDAEINKKIAKKSPNCCEKWQTAVFESVDNDSTIINTNDLDARYRNLVIMDDLVSLGARNQKRVEDLFIRCRKRNCSVIYIGQMFYNIPRPIRLQANYVILFRVSDGREVQQLSNTLALKITGEEFRRLYTEIVREPYSFMYIDVNASELPLHIRKRFDGILDISQFRPPKPTRIRK